MYKTNPSLLIIVTRRFIHLIENRRKVWSTFPPGNLVNFWKIRRTWWHCCESLFYEYHLKGALAFSNSCFWSYFQRASATGRMKLQLNWSIKTMCHWHWFPNGKIISLPDSFARKYKILFSHFSFWKQIKTIRQHLRLSLDLGLKSIKTTRPSCW